MVAGNLEIGLGFLRLRGRCSKMPRLIVAKVTNAPESIFILIKQLVRRQIFAREEYCRVLKYRVLVRMLYCEFVFLL